MKIVILAPWGIGDFLFISNILFGLYKKYPKCSITVLTRNLAVQNFIETIYGVEAINIDLKNFRILIEKLVLKKYDYFFYSYGLNFIKLLLFNLFIRASHKLSLAKYLHIRNILKSKHRIVSNNILYEHTFKDKLPISYYVPQNKIDISRSHDVLIHIGSDKLQSYKRWPIEYWVELVSKFNEKKINVGVLIGPSENELSKNFLLVQCSIYSNLRFDETISQLDCAKLLICGDSGIGHLASSRNVLTLSLFGPSDKFIFAPFFNNITLQASDFNCSPCIKLEGDYGCKHAFCMKSIKPELVFIKAMKLLNV